MTKYGVYATVVGTKYIGEVEAEDTYEAEELAWEHPNLTVSLCHQCSSECEDPEVDGIALELVNGVETERA